MLRILDAAGKEVGPAPLINESQLVDIFKLMVRTRTFNEKALKFQRTGRIPGYYSCSGQEAHVAIPFALEDRDWIFSAYREQGVRFARGISALEELAVFGGKPFAGWNPRERRVTPLNATIGTHLPHATGFGYANKMMGGDEIAVAIFGDGATSEVDFHAALNNAGVWNTPTVFYCQNNLYAQSTPIAQQTAARTIAVKAEAYGIAGLRIDGMDPLAVYAAMSEAAVRARNGNGPTLIEAVCYRYEPHSSYDGAPVYRTREEEDVWRKRDPLIRFQAYLEGKGLIDTALAKEVAADTRAEMDEAIDALDAVALPSRETLYRSVHATTPQRLAEQLQEAATVAGEDAPDIIMPSPTVIEPAADADTRDMTMVQAINLALDHGMKSNDAMLILGEDVGREGGIFRVTEGLFERYGSLRVLDTTLCELGIIGSAIGMAIAGSKPVCEIEFAGFGFTAFDQTTFHAARYHWRTNGVFKMPLLIRMPAGGNHGGLEGHSDSPEAYYAHAPGLTVIYPSNAHDAKGLMASAIESDEPIIFFEPIAQYFVKAKAVPVDHYTIPIGKAKTVREGTDVTMVTYGNPVYSCMEAADILAADGVSAEIIDLRTLKPWDEDAVLDSIKRTGRLVVVHEAVKSGGLGAEIVATASEKACDWLETPPVRVAHPDMVWGVSKLETYSIISVSAIIKAARQTLES